jgi:hypothetical protein
MTGTGDDRPTDLQVHAATDGSQAPDPRTDVLELGSSRAPWSGWRRLSIVGLISLALVVGAAGGYLFGTQRTDRKTVTTGPTVVAPAPTPRALVSAGAQPPTATGNRCSVQLGDQLQLGIEIVNLSTMGVTLLRADVDLPLHGLRATATAWGSCGQLSALDGADPYPLPSGTTAWLRMTFDVLTSCPGPLPVLFSVNYAEANAVNVANLGGFNDLGDVPYTRCSAGPR